MDKSLFASYLNMATCNIGSILCHINNKFTNKNNNKISFVDGYGEWIGLSIITELLNENGNKHKQAKIVREIKRYIPLLAIVNGENEVKNKKIDPTEELKSPNEQWEKFAIILETVSNLRDYYTHAIHLPIETKQIKSSLYKLLTVNLRIAKERFGYESSHCNHLNRGS